jgi:hypothetical protein
MRAGAREVEIVLLVAKRFERIDVCRTPRRNPTGREGSKEE